MKEAFGTSISRYWNEKPKSISIALNSGVLAGVLGFASTRLEPGFLVPAALGGIVGGIVLTEAELGAIRTIRRRIQRIREDRTPKKFTSS